MGVAGVTWPNSKFWYLLNNFWTNRAIRFKFDTDIDDGSPRRVHHKTTLSAVAWVTWPNFEILETHITGKTSKVNYMYINNNKTANIKGKN